MRDTFTSASFGQSYSRVVHDADRSPCIPSRSARSSAGSTCCRPSTGTAARPLSPLRVRRACREQPCTSCYRRCWRSGYVGRGTDDDRFHLRLKVRSLSEGFEDEQWIMAIAGPAFGRAHTSDLMAVRHGDTRWAQHDDPRDHPSHRPPLDRPEHGRANHAHSGQRVRPGLHRIRAEAGAAEPARAPRSKNPHDALARDAAQVSRLILATRRCGYGLRQGGQIWPHTGSIAVPIRVGNCILGCINTIWMARVMISAEEGVRRCLRFARVRRH